MDVIQIVCMECKKDMGTKPAQGTPGTSHSICPTCFDRISKELDAIEASRGIK